MHFFVIFLLLALNVHAQEPKGYYDKTGLWVVGKPPVVQEPQIIQAPQIIYVPMPVYMVPRYYPVNYYQQVGPQNSVAHEVPAPLPYFAKASYGRPTMVRISLDELFGQNNEVAPQVAEHNEPAQDPHNSEDDDSEVKEALSQLQFSENDTYEHQSAKSLIRKTDQQYKIEREQREEKEREKQKLRQQQLAQQKNVKKQSPKTQKKQPQKQKKKKQDDDALLAKYIKENKSIQKPPVAESNPKKTLAQARKEKEEALSINQVRKEKEEVPPIKQAGLEIKLFMTTLFVSGGQKLAQAYAIASTNPVQAVELFHEIHATGLFEILPDNPQLMVQGWLALDLMCDAARNPQIVAPETSDDVFKQIDNFYVYFIKAQEKRSKKGIVAVEDQYLYIHNICRMVQDIKQVEDADAQKNKLDELVDRLNALSLPGVSLVKSLPLDILLASVDEATQEYYDEMSARCEHLFDRNNKTINVVIK